MTLPIARVLSSLSALALVQLGITHVPVLAAFHQTVLNFLEGALLDYGYIIVFLAICIESMGVPFPGETMLLIASAYAANTHHLSIFGVIASAAGGAIFGDSLGYWIGREGGRKLIRSYGKFVGLTDERYQKAQDYLKVHGGKAVFFGRFVSIARTWIAVLVGAHHLNYMQFLLYNVLGGIVWATLYGSLGYLFGENLPLLETWIKRVGIGVSIAVVIVIVYLLYLRKKRKKRLEAEATALSASQSSAIAETKTDDIANL
jgi:membrane protein DedA with SNARE-associated domain